MLDSTDMKIIHLLLRKGCIPLSCIGEHTGMSQQAARKRLQKLRQNGIVLGSSILLNERRIGWERAILALNIGRKDYLKTLESIKAAPLVNSVYTITGPYCLAVEVLGPVGIVKEVTKYIGKMKGVEGLCPLTFVEKIK
ncbi:MAG: AsnC family transcriptional regulator [Candidatus Bilamarchaeaceae archaeon]